MRKTALTRLAAALSLWPFGALADLSADLFAAAIGGTVDRQEVPPVTLFYVMTGASRLDSALLMTFAADAFGALSILPILATPPVAAAN